MWNLSGFMSVACLLSKYTTKEANNEFCVKRCKDTLVWYRPTNEAFYKTLKMFAKRIATFFFWIRVVVCFPPCSMLFFLPFILPRLFFGRLRVQLNSPEWQFSKEWLALDLRSSDIHSLLPRYASYPPEMILSRELSCRCPWFWIIPP